MSAHLDPWPPAAGTADLSAAPGWRASAAELRDLAEQVVRTATDLAAYHRHDVWQGAVPTRFGDDLDRWRDLIGRPPTSDDELSVAGELVAVARRLEARAIAAEVAAGGGDGAFWGRRDPP